MCLLIRLLRIFTVFNRRSRRQLITIILKYHILQIIGTYTVLARAKLFGKGSWSACIPFIRIKYLLPPSGYYPLTSYTPTNICRYVPTHTAKLLYYYLIEIGLEIYDVWLLRQRDIKLCFFFYTRKILAIRIKKKKAIKT